MPHRGRRSGRFECLRTNYGIFQADLRVFPCYHWHVPGQTLCALDPPTQRGNARSFRPWDHARPPCLDKRSEFQPDFLCQSQRQKAERDTGLIVAA